MNEVKSFVLNVAIIGYGTFFIYLLVTGRMGWFLNELKNDVSAFFRTMATLMRDGFVVVNESQRQREDKQD